MGSAATESDEKMEQEELIQKGSTWESEPDNVTVSVEVEHKGENGIKGDSKGENSQSLKKFRDRKVKKDKDDEHEEDDKKDGDDKKDKADTKDEDDRTDEDDKK